MTGPGDGVPLRVALGADAPDHPEAEALAAWLAGRPGITAEVVDLAAAPSADADVVWLHGVRPIRLESLGPGGPDLLLRGRALLTGGAAVLPAAAGVDPAAPNDVGRGPPPPFPDPDGRPPLRGHLSYRGNALFEGLGMGAITWSPAIDEEYTRVVYALPSWPQRARVLAVERSRTDVAADRATIWEYEGEEGRTLCIGAYLSLDGRDHDAGQAAGALVANALRRVGGRSRAGEDSEWRRPDASAREDRLLPLGELPLLEDPVGTLDFRLRRTGPAEAGRPFRVAGRRAYASGADEGGPVEVWAHPVRIAKDIRVLGSRAETVTVTPVGFERRLALGAGTVIERVVVPREAPACVVEWLSRTRTTEIEVDWTCDLRWSGPVPAAWSGPLRWRRAARGVVVVGPGEDRAVFAFSAPPEELEVEDASGGGGAAIRVRARVRLPARAPVRLAVAGAGGDAVLRRALAAADRTAALTRGRQGHAERVLGDGLTLESPDPAADQALEWAKHELDALVMEAPALGRCLGSGTGYDGRAAIHGALDALAVGAFGPARDTLVFLGRHQDRAGRILRSCSTSGFARHDDAGATRLYLLLTARYLAWTGDLATVRTEWPRVMRAYEAALRAPADELLAGALVELADTAESIGESGAAVELRRAGAERGGSAWSARIGDGPVRALVDDVLGVEPDAPRGRLVLRPAPPAGWGRFRVRGLAMGEARVGLHYRETGGTHTFLLAQSRGAAPVRVILEPSLPGRRLARATVDGVAAELDPREAGDRLVVPLQVVMDHDREVVLEIEDGMQNHRRTD